MCTVLLPPGDNPIAANKYIIYNLPYRNRLPRRTQKRECLILVPYIKL